MEQYLINSLDIAGTLAFAISGALAAARKDFDLFGISFTAFITALGGGTVRDLCIGYTPVSWMRDMNYLYIIILAVAVTFLFSKYLLNLHRTLFLFDAIGIGVFTIIGMKKALSLDIHIVMAIMMGITSAVMGGVFRDTFLNEVPLILREEIYATACLLGALIYIGLEYLGVNPVLCLTVTIFFIITIRILSMRYHISLPKITLHHVL